MEYSELKSEAHYHIRWSSIDWKTFATKEEAAECAERMRKPNETFTIVKRDENCERCKALNSKAERLRQSA